MDGCWRVLTSLAGSRRSIFGRGGSAGARDGRGNGVKDLMSLEIHSQESPFSGNTALSGNSLFSLRGQANPVSSKKEREE